MKLNPLIVALSATALLLHSATALTLPVSEDSAASPRGLLTKAAGKAGSLKVAPGRAAFIRFDAGTLSASLTPADVTRARLTFYLPKVTKAGPLALHSVEGEWMEAVSVPAQQPVFEATPIATIPLEAVVSKQFVIVDVTDQLKAWLANPTTDHGFAILSGGIASVSIGAKEGSGSGYPAVLEIESSQLIDDARIAPGISAIKLGTGVVDNVELGYLDGITSAIQTQLNALGVSLSTVNTTLGTFQSQLTSLDDDLDGVTSDLGDLGTTVAGKVSKAGDTMTGALNLPTDGLSVGSGQLTLSGGKIGIGTPSPGAELDVRGNIKLGATGNLFAASGTENLRIITGAVTISGGVASIARGSGFTVTRNSVGNYTINFSSAFSAQPIVTAAANNATVGNLLGLATGLVSTTSGSVNIVTSILTGPQESDFNFIAIGPR